MKKRDIIIFFSVALSVYAAINFYIFLRGWEALPEGSIRSWYCFVFLILSLSYILGRFLERATLSWVSSVFVWIGSFWLAAMVYFLIAAFAIDIVRLINFAVPFFPSAFLRNPALTNEIVLSSVIAIVFLIVSIGYFNARTPRIRKLNFAIAKKNNSMNPLTIAVASDIHLGTIVCKRRLERIVKIINGLHPDLVLLPGDVVDEDIAPVIKQNLGETLQKITSKFGVFAATGNHEYIGGVEPAVRYLSQHGLTMLRDATVKINDGLYIIGREDISYNRASGKKRKSLEELMMNVDRNLPIIMMDHQPFHLEEAEQNGIDVQLSGHTHHGQLWPFNFITKRVYEVSWGYKKKGNTHIYVSSGVGTWGPPVRTGNSPEIVFLTLKFE
jgi:uncharacterized protein